MSIPATLTFNHTEFQVIARDGQPWLQARQLSEALGFSRPDVVLTLYNRHADEFTADMSSTIKMMVEVGDMLQTREVRIFSARGCHLLAMLAKTAVAKTFRKWVLDVLEACAAGRVQALPANAVAVDKDRYIELLEGEIERLRGRRRRPNLTPEERERVRILARQGLGAAAIGRELGLKAETVRSALRQPKAEA